MLEALWIEFTVEVLPFFPEIFTFAMIIFPVAFLVYAKSEVEAEEYLAKTKN